MVFGAVCLLVWCELAFVHTGCGTTRRGDDHDKWMGNIKAQCRIFDRTDDQARLSITILDASCSLQSPLHFTIVPRDADVAPAPRDASIATAPEREVSRRSDSTPFESERFPLDGPPPFMIHLFGSCLSGSDRIAELLECQ